MIRCPPWCAADHVAEGPGVVHRSATQEVAVLEGRDPTLGRRGVGHPHRRAAFGRPMMAGPATRCAPGGSRSHDPALKRRLLYQLSYRGLFIVKRTSTS